MINKKIILLLVAFFSFQACSQTTSSSEKKIERIKIDDNALQELKKFYTSYFSEMEKSDKDVETKLDQLRKKYMTIDLYNKIKHLNLDYDPVINAQDVESDWRKNLSISKSVEDNNKFEISNSFDNSKNYIYITLKKINNTIKIKDIKVNDIPSILNYNETYNNFNVDSLSINYDTIETVINGYYRYNSCDDANPSYYIADDEGQLSFYTQKKHWVSISTSSEKLNNVYEIKYDFITGVSGKNADLNWEDYSSREKIAEIKVINNKQIEFKWYGFYNVKTNQRELLENPFLNNKNPKQEIILNKCNN
ncbi:Protein of unknown function [Chryseobacterium taichungense]|uniref:Uncharacterized protein n=2 Tax=Chryseobacterium taichungense TaxID=295069 RepID=A0A1H7Y7U0_9FLAO|nr:Protein of unknown function [Chryseobacterium taichungense]